MGVDSALVGKDVERFVFEGSLSDDIADLFFDRINVFLFEV